MPSAYLGCASWSTSCTNEALGFRFGWSVGGFAIVHILSGTDSIALLEQLSNG